MVMSVSLLIGQPVDESSFVAMEEHWEWRTGGCVVYCPLSAASMIAAWAFLNANWRKSDPPPSFALVKVGIGGGGGLRKGLGSSSEESGFHLAGVIFSLQV